MRLVPMVFDPFRANPEGGNNVVGRIAHREDDHVHPALDGSKNLEPVFAIVVPAFLRNYAPRV